MRAGPRAVSPRGAVVLPLLSRVAARVEWRRADNRAGAAHRSPRARPAKAPATACAPGAVNPPASNGDSAPIVAKLHAALLEDKRAFPVCRAWARKVVAPDSSAVRKVRAWACPDRAHAMVSRAADNKVASGRSRACPAVSRPVAGRVAASLVLVSKAVDNRAVDNRAAVSRGNHLAGSSVSACKVARAPDRAAASRVVAKAAVNRVDSTAAANKAVNTVVVRAPVARLVVDRPVAIRVDGKAADKVPGARAPANTVVKQAVRPVVVKAVDKVAAKPVPVRVAANRVVNTAAVRVAVASRVVVRAPVVNKAEAASPRVARKARSKAAAGRPVKASRAVTSPAKRNR